MPFCIYTYIFWCIVCRLLSSTASIQITLERETAIYVVHISSPKSISLGLQIELGFCFQVFGIPLERCSNYSTCGECTSSRDPLCGWCALDQYCSRDAHCTRSSDEGRWVNRQELCIISVSLATNSMDVDLIKSVSLE